MRTKRWKEKRERGGGGGQEGRKVFGWSEKQIKNNVQEAQTLKTLLT